MLDKKKDVPLYVQLKEELIKKIENEMEIGALLPTEKELESQYNVSRMTVRSAIDELKNEGFVTKQQGKGTFVNQKKMTQDVGTIFSWTEEMKLQNKQSQTTIIDMKEAVPSKEVMKSLKIQNGEKVITLTRVRQVDNEPIVIMVNYLKEKYVPELLKDGLQSESLYEELETKYNIFLEKADEIITAREATAFEASMLNVSEGSALLHVRRTSYMKNNIPVEVVDMIARGDKYQYFAELEGRNKYIKQNGGARNVTHS